MKTKTGAQRAGNVSDLRKAYPELAPGKDYPPLKLPSLKGKVSAAEWEARVDCASALIKVNLAGKVPWEPAFPKGLGYKFNLRFDKVACHDYEGVVLEEGEKARLLAERVDPSYKN